MSNHTSHYKNNLTTSFRISILPILKFDPTDFNLYGSDPTTLDSMILSKKIDPNPTDPDNHAHDSNWGHNPYVRQAS